MTTESSAGDKCAIVALGEPMSSTSLLFDVAIELENRPGALADMGEALGAAGVSIEGGGAWVVGERGVAHFLFRDGEAARRALTARGIRVVAVREVVAVRLHQGVPGQLGKLTRRMAQAGVNIEALYSDHDHQLILVVNNAAAAQGVAEGWTRERAANDPESHSSP